MSSLLNQIAEEIQAQTAIDFSVSPYVSGIDMTDLVVIGAEIDPQQIPFASITFAGATSERARVQCKWKTTAIFEIYLIVGGGTKHERLTNAFNLCTDMVRSIVKESTVLSNRLSGQIDDVIPSIQAIDGEDEYVGRALGLIRLEIPYQNAIGM